ncbi:Retrovirus-related Pol polyprotein from transposon TNT 1-94 [Vitis vinifera]|uniref:Retrovirus-related Pol polyprotein from transposon TNT 1-94 n=1 Tax=Vitis vinifera TaxID=29760 RepID=A0A438H8H1_VITVI|nr:Retrovirus-related Pol polyprotein from transposon TNT 1-94 [Vitis vinifera]
MGHLCVEPKRHHVLDDEPKTQQNPNLSASYCQENPVTMVPLLSLRRSIHLQPKFRNGFGAVQACFRCRFHALFRRRSRRVQAPLAAPLEAPFAASFRHHWKRRSGPFKRHHSDAISGNRKDILASFSASSISANVNIIPVLNGTNFKKWKEHVIIVLGCMDLDYALRVDRPSDLTSASTAEQRSAMEKWERSNRMSLMIMKHSIPETIRGTKVRVVGRHTRALGLDLSAYTIQSIQNQLQHSKEKWTLNELILSVYKRNKIETRKDRKCSLGFHISGIWCQKKRKRDNKGKQTAVSETSKQKVQKKQDKEITCFFCKKAGHMKKTCTKYAAWREKKGTLLNFVCSEINLAVVPTDTWWIDTGATTHISVTMQDICGPFLPSWNGQQYFITFIDDYSRYGYLYLIHEKSQSLDVFKNFKAEVENQLRPFAKYLMECGIVPQYTMPGTPSQNVYILNRVPSKAVAKTPYELWTSKKPSIRHLHVWGCPAEARPYKPNEKKLDSRTFIEDVELSGREPLRKVVFEEESVSIPTTGHGHIMFDDTIQNVQSITEIQDTPEIPPAQVMEPFKFMKRPNGIQKAILLGIRRLVAKGFTQKEGIDYKETFSPVSSKDSFRIIMALVAHYDLELHQMDIKKVHIWFKASIPTMVPKFDQVITSFGFKENIVDQCIYLKFSGSKFIILVLYVDDILLASSDVGLLHETKRFLSSKFDMKDLGDASFVLGDKFSLHQCPKNELEKKDMEGFPMPRQGSLMYAQVCTRPDIAYIVGMLGRYLSNPEIVGYSDSDFAGCLDSRRSTSGYIFMLAGEQFHGKVLNKHLLLLPPWRQNS